MLHVAPAVSAFVNLDLLIRHSVAIGVPVCPEIEGIRDPDHDPVIEWQDKARKQEIVRVNTMLVVGSIAIGVDVFRDPALRLLLARRIRILHVGQHLHDIHRAVRVPCAHHRLLDLRFAEDQLEAVAFGQLDGFQGLLLGEISALIDFLTGRFR